MTKCTDFCQYCTNFCLFANYGAIVPGELTCACCKIVACTPWRNRTYALTSDVTSYFRRANSGESIRQHATEIPRYGCRHPAWNDAGRGQPAARNEFHGIPQGTTKCFRVSLVALCILNSQFSIFNSHRFVHGYRYSCRLDKSCLAKSRRLGRSPSNRRRSDWRHGS